MDRREQLKSMLYSMINDKPEQASLAMHNYLTAKMRQVSGIAQQPQINTDSITGSDTVDDTE